jgi:hypothetical protein
MSPRDSRRWQSAASTTGCLQDWERSNLTYPTESTEKPGSPRLWHWLTKGVVHYEAMYVTKCARRPDTPPQREGDRDVSSAAFLPVPIPAFVSSL